MLAKEIQYTDFDGVTRKETHHFNFTKAELAKSNFSHPGGAAKTLSKIAEEINVPAMIEIFTRLILDSYGEISSDGRRFIKSKEMSEAFSQTNAYSELFMELFSNADAALEFIIGVMPSDIAEEIRKANSESNVPAIAAE